MAVYIIYKRLALDFPRVRDYNVGWLICVKEERKMKIHKNNATHRGVSKRSTYFLLYTAAFLICSACIYVWFARTGRSLISTGDGWKQHFPAFVYFGQYGRTVLRTLLTEHQLVLPQWNFSLGYGGDILTTLHYYVIGDPLDLLSIACPTRYAVYLYSFLSLFRLYLAGLGFGAFCRYKKQGAPLPVAVGSVCYVFFTYSFLLVARHPFFAIPMVYLPLLFLGVEQVLAKRRPYLLIVTVFLAAVSNFYFFYMLAIITAIYTVYRLCCLYDRHSAKQAVGGLLQVTLWAVVGVLMSAAILLPVILTFIGDNRNGVQYPLTLLYDADFYRNFLAAYTTSHNQAYQTYLGFNAVALPAICLLYFKRKPEEKPLRILFLLATAALLIPVFGWALNGFSYMANRWVWAYSLLVAYIVTTQWKKLRHITVGQAVACVGALALYSLLAIPLMTTDARNIGVSVLLAFLIIVLCALAPRFKKKHLATALVLVLVLTSFTGNAAYFYSSHGKHKTDTFVATEKVNRRIKGASGRKVKKAAKSDKSFYRYTGDNVECNEELLAHMSGSSFYWSLQNPNVAQYVTETEQPVENSYRYNRLNTSAALNALTGVKYYAATKSTTTLPYGFTPLQDKIYQSGNALPLGYTYDSAITRADYEKLSSLEKQQAMLQGVVLDNVPTGTAQTALSFTDKSLPYTITADENVAIDGKKIHVYDKGAKVTLHFNGTPNSETYLRMGLRNYTDYPAYTYYKTQENDPLHRYSTDKWNKKDDSQKAYVRRKARSFKAPSSLTLQYTAHTADGAALTPQSTVTCTQTHLRFEGYKVQMVNAGYSKDAKTDITVTFDARGIYDFSTLEVLEQPMTDTDRQVAKLAENTLENIQIGTDTVDGTVTLDRSKILLLTIPYCDGWTATVDGKEAQLLQANTMFSALALEPGEHTIHLTYRTPHLKAGLAVSVLGFAAFGATLLCTEVKKRKERKA